MLPLSLKKSESVVLKDYRTSVCLAPKRRNSYVSLGQRPRKLSAVLKTRFNRLRFNRLRFHSIKLVEVRFHRLFLRCLTQFLGLSPRLQRTQRLWR